MRTESLGAALVVGLLSACAATAQERAAHDDFDRLVAINRASLVMLVAEGLVSRPLGRDIGNGIDRIVAEQAEPGAARSPDYLVFEQRLLEIAGPEASRLHTGRSRQDIGSTYRRMALRDALLETYTSLLVARTALLALAGRHVETVVPAYTHGVQAQPTSFAHYLLAFSAAFGRDAERLEAAYVRLNRSPLGAAALTTSGFPLDRQLLAGLLGFGGVVENSYDANLVSSVDSKIEFANALSTSAITVGQLMQNLHTQYHDPEPWILLAASQTSGSSIMPQKRNPRPLDRVRLLASEVVSAAHAVTLNAHNANSGMNDYRAAAQALETAAVARNMYGAYARLISNLVVDEERALAEVEADYSTMTEVADVLLREAGVPFRVGHHYASELTAYGRGQGKRPKDLADDELVAVYARATGEAGLPLPVERIREAFDPAAMVGNRRGLGGPQPAAVRRMLAGQERSLATGHDWLDAARQQLARAAARLDRRFAALK